MVSRGISTPDILRGIHESMAGRFARLIRSLPPLPDPAVVFVSGGPSGDAGLLAATVDALAEPTRGKAPDQPIALVTHPLGIQAGAIGAALWGAFRHRKLETREVAWTRTSTMTTASPSAR
jgi:benzoyl-CoA reductase subunit D